VPWKDLDPPVMRGERRFNGEGSGSNDRFGLGGKLIRGGSNSIRRRLQVKKQSGTPGGVGGSHARNSDGKNYFSEKKVKNHNVEARARGSISESTSSE